MNTRAAVVLGSFAALILFAYLPLGTAFGQFLQSGVSGAEAVWNPRTQGLLKNTLAVAGGTSALAVLLGVPYALATERLQPPGAAFLRPAALVPAALPPYISAIAWVYLLGEQGALNTGAARALNADAVPFRLDGLGGTILVGGLAGYPYVVVATMAALRSATPRLEEAAALHHGWIRAMRGVTLPLARPGILTGALVVCLLGLADFGVPAIFGVNVFTMEIYEQFSVFQNLPAVASASGLLILVAGAALLALGFLHGPIPLQPPEASIAPLFAPGACRWLGGAYCWLLLAVSVALPCGVLAREAGRWDGYASAWQSASEQIGNSLLFSGVTACLLVVGAFGASYSVARSRGAAEPWLRLLAVMPYAIPGSITGVGLILLWNRAVLPVDVYGSPAIVMLAYLGRNLPITILILAVGVAWIPRSLEEAAAVHGISWPRSTVRVIVPLLAPTLACAWVVSLLLCLHELPATVLVAPAGAETLPIRLFSLMHYGASEVMAALALCMAVISILPAALALWLVRPRRHGTS